MNEKEATELATRLLGAHGDQGFEIAMTDTAGYNLMRTVLAQLGRESGPDGKFFIVRVAPIHGAGRLDQVDAGDREEAQQ